LRKTLASLTLAAFFAASLVPALAATKPVAHKACAKSCEMHCGSCQMPCAACGTKATAKPAAPKKIVSAVCPVMGTKIPDVTKAVGKSVYKGKTYYFCCAGCKPKFDKNPEKYIKKH
jgi:YHS domain-containing protein